MEQRKVVQNFFYQASYQMLVVMLPIITVPIVSKALQPEGIGTWNYVNSIVSYFTLVAGLGLSSYGVREVAFSRESKEKLSKKFWEIQGFNVFFSGLVLIVYLIFSYFSRFKILFFLQSLTVLATLLDISWFFQGIEDFKKISFLNYFVKIFTFILTVTLIKEKSDLATYVGIIGFSSFISGLSFWFFIRNKIIWIKVSLRDMWSHFVPALNFFVIKMASTLFNNLNKTILGIMTSMGVVGIFSNSLVIVMLITTLFNSLNTVLLPRMSSLQKNNEEKKMLDLLSKAIDIQVFMTTGCMFITLGVIGNLIEWFLGNSFSQVKSIVPILAPVMVFAAIQQAIANMYLVPKNKISSFAKTIIVGTIINLLLCFILIPNTGAYGAAIGYLIGQIYIAISRVRILQNETAYRFNYKNLTLCLISGILTYVVVYLISLTSITGIILTFIQGLFGVIVYLFLTIMCKVNPLLPIISKIKKK